MMSKNIVVIGACLAGIVAGGKLAEYMKTTPSTQVLCMTGGILSLRPSVNRITLKGEEYSYFKRILEI